MTDTALCNLREKLRIEMEIRGLSQRELCRLAGVTPCSLSRYLAGKCDLKTGTWEKLWAVIVSS